MLFNPPGQPPRPGEIWEIGFETQVMGFGLIVREVDEGVTVMLLTAAIGYSNRVNLLLPVTITGLDRAVLAETWNVEAIAIDHLKGRIGNRLSREIYDVLLSIGDFYHGLSISMPDLSLIQAVGLDLRGSQHTKGEIADFHRQEKVWLQSLHPVTMARTANLVDQAIAMEREFAITVARISLSRWLQQFQESTWQDVLGLNLVGAMAIRHLLADNEIADTIANLAATDSEVLRRQLIKRMGVAIGNRDAQQALVQLVKQTVDDETLWTAIDSLQRIVPDYPVGVKRLKQVDVGVLLNFVVSVVSRADQKISVRLQVTLAHPVVDLPVKLKMLLLDGNEQELWQVVAQDGDYCIQIKFNGVPGEEFGVCLELGEQRAIEAFVI